MCITAPGRVLAVDGDVAKVDLDGRTRTVSTLLVRNLEKGDRVLVGLGTVLERLSPTAADELGGAVAVARGASVNRIQDHERTTR